MSFDTQNEILDALQKQNHLLEKLLKAVKNSEYTNNISEYLTVKEVAKVLKRTPRTIRNWIHSGKLKGVKLNRGIQQDQFYIYRNDVDSLLNQSRLLRRTYGVR